jgi:hypothetical protein
MPTALVGACLVGPDWTALDIPDYNVATTWGVVHEADVGTLYYGFSSGAAGSDTCNWDAGSARERGITLRCPSRSLGVDRAVD